MIADDIRNLAKLLNEEQTSELDRQALARVLAYLQHSPAAQPAPVQEPVAWVLTAELDKRETTTRAHLWFSNPQNCMWTPIYTTPPAAPVQEPLTDEQIKQAKPVCADFVSFRAGVRYAEARYKEKQPCSIFRMT